MSNAIQVNFIPKNEKIKISSKNNVATVSSLEVARRFNKKHKVVLKGIRDILDTVEGNSIGHNFMPNEYKDSIGRTLPCYDLTKYAFMLVAMGFTGREAMAWKVKFIEAFDYLEQQYIENLKKASRPTLPTSKQGNDTLTTTLRALELTQKGCTVAEAGRVINTPESTIRGRIRRIKKAMLPVFIKQLQAN